MSGCNVASLPLNPTDAFLLSRIDSVLSDLDLAFVTGMSTAEVAASLDHLARLGAIGFTERDEPRAPRQVEAAAAGYDRAEIDEAVDLDIEKKKRILELFARLDELTYYELLGVGTQADKKQIKSAYYGLAPEFHPDKYFRKNLGSYKPKIEAIFARITLAHDVLTAPDQRVEYDEYLETTSKNRSMSAVLEQDEPDVAAVKAAVEQTAAAALRAQPGRYQEVNKRSPVERTSPGVAPAPAMSPEEVLRRRRDALARKLTGGRRPAPTPVQRPRVVEMDPEVAARAAEALRVRHEAALADARRVHVQRHIEAGRTALAREDYAAAANAYRIVASLAPDDQQVQATCEEAMKVVAAALADGYWKQAMYEESQERWAEAALSYAKVCAGRPQDGIAHERVANATLRVGANVRRAVEFARKAVELAPTSPEFRVTLARTYGAAGLEKSMNGELDRALELSKNSPKIAAIVAQVRATSPKESKVS